ncbi:MAG: GNAT family N-acetyltransferase [Chloroflexi bacterium]|nr:GNAT family N-acetyltransferase [Chloroflexota bacterium]
MTTCRSGQPHPRHMTPDDLKEAWDLISVGLNAVRATVNRPPLPQRKAMLTLLEHLLATGPESCWCLEGEGRLEGLCLAAPRGKQWFLSHFWMRPDAKNRGRGWPLLRQVWAQGQAAGHTLCLTHASPDPTAHALYTRLGMSPRWPTYKLEASTAAAAQLADGTRLSVRPFAADDLPKVAQELQRLDLMVRGADRPADHRFWLRSLGARAALVHHPRNGEAIGYWYACPESGILGPITCLQPALLPQMVGLAAQALADMSPAVCLYAPTPPLAPVMRRLLRAGFRIALFNVLFASGSLPRPGSYVPSGPDLW